MITIQVQLIGTPMKMNDERGEWESAIYRKAVIGPVELGLRGLLGDRVANTKHHGSPDQAVCCHPLAHYAHWNQEYSLTTSTSLLGPGSVGENWTLTGVTEEDFCIGDIYQVGTARVQVSQPRVPCSKQERKLGLDHFVQRTLENLRTGFYVRVLTPGVVQAGDELRLEARLNPTLSLHKLNQCMHHSFDPEFAVQAAACPELSASWREKLRQKGGFSTPE